MAKLTLSTLAIAGLLICAGAAQAQIRGYTPPAGRALPNELQYFRNDVGVLDPYNQFVAPTRQIQSDFRYLEQQRQNDFRKVQTQLQKNKQIRESVAAPTGTASHFMDLSHFYGNSGGATRFGRR